MVVDFYSSGSEDNVQFLVISLYSGAWLFARPFYDDEKEASC